MQPEINMQATNTIQQLIAQRDALQAEWDAKHKGIQYLRKLDAHHNEGGGGYSQYEDAAEDLAKQYLTPLANLNDHIFAAEWTLDVTQQRRAHWNAEIAAHVNKVGRTITSAQVGAIVKRLGYRACDIARAKQLHGI